MIDLPRLGMGTAPLGNLYRPMSDEAAAKTIAAARSAGLRFFDTAPHYGFGLAEHRLGRALAGHADVVLSTKVGRRLVPTTAVGERHGFVDAWPFEPEFDYSVDGVRRSLDGSLHRLGRSRVDLLLAHDLGRLTHGDAHGARLREFLDGGYPAMRQLKDDGRVGAIGVGVNEVEICLELIGRVELDVILIAGRYTLLDRSAAALLAAAEQQGIRIVVGGPYNSGILARSVTGKDARYDYAPADAAMVSRAQALEAMCATFGVPLPAAALQFPLQHPAVCSVIPGLASANEVTQAVERARLAMPSALWAALEARS